MKNDRPSFMLVTGAAGFIGSHLAEALLESGLPVLGLDNFDPFYPREMKEANLSAVREVARRTGAPFVFVENDVNDLSSGALDDYAVETVFHLAAKAGVRPSLAAPAEYLHANIEGTLAVLEFCRKKGIERLIYGSSSSVYGNDTPVPFKEASPAVRPISPYAATKRAGELLCASYAHLYGLRVASLRFFTVYGPRQRPDLAIHKFAQLIADGAPVVLYGDGSSSRDYTYVSDIVDGIRRAATWLSAAAPGTYEEINLGGATTTPLRHLIELLERHLGRRATLVHREAQPGDVERTFADVTKAHRLLGFQPAVRLDQGIAKFVDWFRERNAVPRKGTPSRLAG